jgi:hypothetical protein
LAALAGRDRVDWRHGLVLGCGVALIVLGFVGWHVNVAAVVIGLILVGALSGDMVVKAIRSVGSAGPEGAAPSAGSAQEGNGRG